MLGSQVNLRHRTDSESINGQLIGKAKYGRTLWIVSQCDFSGDPLFHYRTCAVFRDPKAKSAGVVLGIDYIGEGKKRKLFPQMANTFNKFHLRRLNYCLNLRPIGSIFHSPFEQIKTAEAIKQSGQHNNQ